MTTEQIKQTAGLLCPSSADDGLPIAPGFGRLVRLVMSYSLVFVQVFQTI